MVAGKVVQRRPGQEKEDKKGKIMLVAAGVGSPEGALAMDKKAIPVNLEHWNVLFWYKKYAVFSVHMLQVLF